MLVSNDLKTTNFPNTSALMLLLFNGPDEVHNYSYSLNRSLAGIRSEFKIHCVTTHF